ncbi:flagellar hook-associated protein FlgK [Alteribacillus iranensis]|uniref:Flagellar hook-associated protein 1 n=1 Tax=Alteribacillus iranensis TaxID=930128 RepID=A0A1I2EJR1_9BACI|nr:flagellar hook-associated protein FlgK [Alteribacillus iranensis]SFE92746.1 flagellar hook-associated protein 1 FlgK [Alteribacillus iranensis]
MYSTFHGLETARRAMNAHQAAIHTTGNNIANANTEGYSRQRVNFTQETPFPNPGRNAPRIPGQIGTGVKADSVQRIRENYLDIQFRGENAQAGYWEKSHDIYTRIEDLMNEPSDNSIGRTLDRFWQSLQDLSVHPEDEGARSVVRQRGVALADTFNYISDSLEANRQDLKKEMDTTQKEVNSMLEQINELNKQIARVEPHGHLPNKLYDERDLLIDRLSGMINIEVERNESKGQAVAAAEGTVDIFLLNEEGDRLTTESAGETQEVMVINGESGSYESLSITFGEDATSVSEVAFGNTQLDDLINSSPGKIQALVKGYGYDFGDGVSGVYPELLKDLDEMVHDFAVEFNKVHQSGVGLDGSDEVNFYSGIDMVNTDNATNASATIRVSEEIMEDLKNIAAASKTAEGDEGYAGDGSNALNLAAVKDKVDVQGTYQGIIGDLAVKTMEAGQMRDNTGNLKESIEFNRQQVSSVSLDEEMTNLIQFQHAFNAAARNITMVDEMLDRIINNMGIVGR